MLIMDNGMPEGGWELAAASGQMPAQFPVSCASARFSLTAISFQFCSIHSKEGQCFLVITVFSSGDQTAGAQRRQRA